MHLKAGRDVVLRVELHAALFQLSRVADHIANLDRIIDGCLQILEVIEESGGVELEGAKIAAQADFATLDRLGIEIAVATPRSRLHRAGQREPAGLRSEARRVGKGCDSSFRSLWSQYP